LYEGFPAVTVEQLQSLTTYNHWANASLLEAASALSVEERERDLRASFGSLQGTLIHILWGERGWLHFWQHGTFVPVPTSGEYPNFASIQKAWNCHDAAYEGYLQGLTHVDLDAPRTLEADTYTLGELIQHAINHSTYHRGQVALLIRQLGHVPPSTDYHDFLAKWRAGTT
jgi:uncharacterized damage-inducible protein DinB